MRILILGAGKMGSFFTDLLSFDHEVAVYDNDPRRMRFLYNTQRFTSLDEVDAFNPELVINAVSLKYTLQVFDELLPHVGKDCILSDISSVKTGFREYYEQTGRRYASSHPMFGPTFANLGQLSNENAIIISEGDYMGRIFFRDLYARLGLNVKELTFAEHDETMSYSLSIPFVSTFVFSAVMKHQDTPGTTFKRHMKIARGVLSEDDTLLREILFNPHTKPKVERIRTELKELIQIIDDRDEEAMTTYLTRIRRNIEN
ncbi:MAG: prephenate dehydrogenase [Bacteroidaceae bacterium]|nr:prephenate dehydrogenase [Bacteroidaceae bacterium]MBR1755282.1 prephenate dehydrogenase [Bacteroidaceae bacterium]